MSDLNSCNLNITGKIFVLRVEMCGIYSLIFCRFKQKFDCDRSWYHVSLITEF
ncbi:MAG: hypothetical protein HC903_02165 [Methylacidiphilales bacterium]|nr:hypothetical protein [Candidatus Methylacidiphilales bacterium]